MKKRLFGTLLTVCSFTINAQQVADATEVVKLQTVELTSTKFQLNANHSGKVVLKLTQADLKQYRGFELTTLLDQLAGIDIIGNQSAAGLNLSYSFRGGSNRQVLILIDGVAINNPSSISNDYDLRLLPLDQVESIEIIKGAASALYGSGAATAVINIKLKSAEKDFKATLNTSVATNNSQDKNGLNLANFERGITFSQAFRKADVYFAFQDHQSTGLSAAKGIGFKNDPFGRQNILLKYQLKALEKLSFTSLVNYNKFNTNFDAGSFADAENESISEEFRVGFQSVYTYPKGDFNFKSAFNTINNNNEKTSFPSINKGNTLVFDAYNRYYFNDQLQVLLGLNAQKNEMTSFEIPFGQSALTKVINQVDYTILDPYANVVLNTKGGFNLNVGARLNHHSTYGSHFIYTLNPSYLLTVDEVKLKLMASYSTAYITPTLFQLFSPDYGYQNLNPEENKSLESGFTLNYKKVDLDLIYFYRQEQNFIDFTLLDPSTFAFGYRNTVQDFYASGLETSLKLKVSDKINFSSNYTFTQVAATKIRVPKHKINAHLSWELQAQTHIGLDFNFTDKRTDSFFDLSTFSSSRVVLKSYSLVNLQANRSFLNRRFNVFAHLTNIFNVDYQELVGFTTRGRNVLVGFQFDIQ